MEKKRKRDDKPISKKKLKFDTCVICLEPMKNKMIDLPCGHTFHQNCIDQWICYKNSCPCCRKPVCETMAVEEYIALDPIELDNLFFPLVIEV